MEKAARNISRTITDGKQLKWGRDSIEDNPKSGRPPEARTEEIFSKVEDFAPIDGRVQISIMFWGWTKRRHFGF